MMKTVLRTITLLLLFTSTYDARCQEVSTYPGISYTALSKMEKDGDFITLNGSCDQLYYSDDNATTWNSTELPWGARKISLIPGDPNHRMIISYFGGAALYDLKDGVIQDFYTDTLVQNLGNFNNSLIVGDEVFLFGTETVLKGKLGEYEWSTIFKDTLENDYAYTMEATSDAIIFGTHKGRIFKLVLATNDVTMLHDLGEWITDLSMGTDLIGYIDWRGGNILKTTDGWATYEEVEGLPESINPIAYGENIVFTVNTNRIYRSMDGGKTSERITTANNSMFALTSDAYMTKSGELYLMGRNAMIVRTSDFGDSFEHLNPLIRANLRACDMSSQGLGYVGGEYGQILKSSDFGASWAPIDVGLDDDAYISDLEVLNSGKVFLSLNDKYVILENDKIVSAEDVEITTACYNVDDNSIYALDRTNNPSINVIKSTDDGATWSIIAEDIPANRFITCSADNRIYVPLQDGAVMISDDGGMTWETKQYGVESIVEINGYGDTELYIVGRDLFKTTDGGATSEQIQSGYLLRNIEMASDQHFLVTIGQNSSTNLRETTDGGEQFKTLFRNCTTTISSVINNDNIILGQTAGHINVVPLTGPSSTSDLDSDLDDLFYPNPVAVNGLIKSKTKWDRLEMYTLQGQLIKAYDSYQESIELQDTKSGAILIKAQIGAQFKVQLCLIQ